MRWLRIRNSGEIESNALFLLGASSKRDDDTKIGFFGSGAKYALAVLLREGIPVRAFSGEREIAIGVQDVDFRGTTFGQIILDGQPTSFTTSMGPTWATWFALRELICNALDEGGAEWVEFDDADDQTSWTGGVRDTTTFCVGLDHPELAEFIENLDDYLLPVDAVPLYETTVPDWPKNVRVSVHPASSESRHFFYRRGVLVSEHNTDTYGLFRYDFSDAAVNESRIASQGWALVNLVTKAWAGCTDDDLVVRVFDAMRSNAQVWEAGISFGSDEILSESWFKAVEAVTGSGGQIIPEALVGFLPAEDTQGALVLGTDLYDALLRSFKGRLNFRTESTEYVETSCEDAKKAADRIQDFALCLAEVDLTLAPGFRVVVGDIRANGVLASTNPKTRLVVISREHAENASDEEFEATLAEEFLHSHGYSDGSRAFEEWLIKRLIEARREGRDAVRRLTAIRNIV